MAKSRKKKLKNKAKGLRKILFSILIVFSIIIGGLLYYATINLNRIVAENIHSIYNQSQLNEYYSLDFKKLRINLIESKIKILHLSFKPRKSFHKQFFIDNGSMNINIGEITLKNADIIKIISDNIIVVDKLLIKDSDINLVNTSSHFNPFSFIKPKVKNDTLQLDISLGNIQINKAKLNYITDVNNPSGTNFKDFNFEIVDFSLKKDKETVMMSLIKMETSLSEARYNNNKGVNIGLEKLSLEIDGFLITNSAGKFNYNYKSFLIKLQKPSFETKDKVYSISSNYIIIDELRRTLNIDNVSIMPLLSKKDFANNYKYQELRPEINLDKVKLVNIDYRNLFDFNNFVADSLLINGGEIYLYKDNRKPLNKNKFPKYLAKQIFNIKLPLKIDIVKANNIDIHFSAKQPNNLLSKIDIQINDASLNNIQNIKSDQKLKLNATGKVHNSIPFNVNLLFDYSKDVFSFKGNIQKSDLITLRKPIRSFLPVEIRSGIIQNMKFNGYASRTTSKGNMVFLYNNLNIEIQNNNKVKKKGFQNIILSTAANTIMLSNNPVHADAPPRKVNFEVARDMNRGFINILIKSLLSGMKESLLPSKENRKQYKKVKKYSKHK
ncbi:MAG: hypothetical protein DRI86_02685 [Bacteroidetes bacterium]|nr:MAG: hypothetical protein DRI86_02685 [Bacteroidota bacterium]